MSLFSIFRNKKQAIQIGDELVFGTYQQEGDTPTKVAWIILTIKDGKALLISKYALITSGYCESSIKSFKQLEWEGSLAREKCKRFFDECFSESERSAICEKKIEMNGFGGDCIDRVFLLSETEAKEYLPSPEDRKCKPTPKAIASGARMGWTDDTRDYTSWWILPECKRGGLVTLYDSDEKYAGMIYPKAVFQMGEIQFHSRNIYHQDFCIRPSILVEIETVQRLLKYNSEGK